MDQLGTNQQASLVHGWFHRRGPDGEKAIELAQGRGMGVTLRVSEQKGEGEGGKDGCLGMHGNGVVKTWSALNLLPNTEHCVKVWEEPQGLELNV